MLMQCTNTMIHLAQAGSVVIDPVSPQAHFINCRTMEVFRQMSDGGGKGGTLAQRVSAASPPLDQWRKFTYCESLTGPVFGEVDHFKAGSSPPSA